MDEPGINQISPESSKTTESQPNGTKSNSLNQNIRNFIDNTKLSDIHTMHESKVDGPNPDEDFDDNNLNEFNLNLPVHEDPPQEDGEEEDEEEVRNYHKNLKYFANKNFNDSLPNSIPNTFKYKSFPNARTKNTLGTGHDSTKLEISKQLDASIENENSMPQDKDPKDKSMDKTPDWMPSELNERWLESKLSGSNFNSLNPKPSINFQLPSSNNSIIHNFISKQTPDWKKVKQNYDDSKKVNLQQVFMDKSDVNNFNSLSSTLSTPYNSLKPDQLNKDQLKYLTAQSQEANSASKEKYTYDIENDSPLKLFRLDYNTFTKGKLNELICNLKAPPPPFNLQKSKILEESETQGENNEVEHIDDFDSVDSVDDEVKSHTSQQNEFMESDQQNEFMESDQQNEFMESDQQNEFMASVQQKPLNDIQEVPEDLKSVEDSYTFESTEDKENSSFSGNPMPKLKTKNFTNDIESKFKMKANNIFDNIQKRGNFLKTSNNFSISNSINGTAIATATSTPKVNKVLDVKVLEESNDNVANSNEGSYNSNNNTQAYSSFTSGFNQEDTTQFQELDKEDANTNEYTSFSSSNISSSDNENEPNKLSDSYTYEQISDDHSVASGPGVREKDTELNSFSQTITSNGREASHDSLSNTIISNNSEKQNELEERIKFLESQLGSVNVLKNNIDALTKENNHLRQMASQQVVGQPQVVDPQAGPYAEESFADVSQFDQLNDFKMKRVSQLKLQQRASPHLKPPSRSLNQLTPSKGNLNPMNFDLPSSYENMVLDEVNHRWIIKNENRNELDDIESLVDESDVEDMEELVKKEVSFQLPHTDQVKSSPMSLPSSSHSNSISSDTSNHRGANITRVSEIGELSFSEQQKSLVSIITDALINKEQDWNLVESIAFDTYELNNIKDLKLFLPNLKNISLANNKLKYLNGLPNSIISMNVENNEINNLSNFQKLINLQKLDLLGNNLTNCKNLRSNIHLTRLNLSKNEIHDLSGLNDLTNLISLDLSNNKLTGTIDFSKFQFDNLQDLNMSENAIEVVDNLQQAPNLRILNVNENKIRILNCATPHPSLKKLLIKVNNLRQIEMYQFPYVRVLRVDGNLPNMMLIGLETTKYLEEMSIKCFDSKDIMKLNERNLQSVRILDISGNKDIFRCLSNNDQFINLNRLNMVSIDLTALPPNFHKIFPNLIELNLNFNKLETLDQLNHYKNLKKVSVISNKLTKIESVIVNLKNSRKSIKFLDLRLNFINQNFYPFLFNPNEVNIPIELEELDDIENFNILYNSLLNQDFNDMNLSYDSNLTTSQMTMKQHYLTLLINFFPNLRRLDGCLIDNDIRLKYSRMIN